MEFRVVELPFLTLLVRYTTESAPRIKKSFHDTLRARGVCSRTPHLRHFCRASHKHFSAHVHHLRIIPFPKPSPIQSVKKIPPLRSDLASIIFFTLFNPTSASKSTQPSISPCPPRPPPSASTARKTARSPTHTNSARTWQQCSKIFYG